MEASIEARARSVRLSIGTGTLAFTNDFPAVRSNMMRAEVYRSIAHTEPNASKFIVVLSSGAQAAE